PCFNGLWSVTEEFGGVLSLKLPIHPLYNIIARQYNKFIIVMILNIFVYFNFQLTKLNIDYKGVKSWIF
ncbi:MAG: hypothetical protein WBH44_06855, partial [Proteocatella sp.]